VLLLKELDGKVSVAIAVIRYHFHSLHMLKDFFLSCSHHYLGGGGGGYCSIILHLSTSLLSQAIMLNAQLLFVQCLPPRGHAC
jgi:hypothetical protein